jgi:hypothetical protein
MTDGYVPAEFALKITGKQAPYAMRWIGTTREPNRWGSKVPAVIAA